MGVVGDVKGLITLNSIRLKQWLAELTWKMDEVIISCINLEFGAEFQMVTNPKSDFLGTVS